MRKVINNSVILTLKINIKLLDKCLNGTKFWRWTSRKQPLITFINSGVFLWFKIVFLGFIECAFIKDFVQQQRQHAFLHIKFKIFSLVLDRLLYHFLLLIVNSPFNKSHLSQIPLWLFYCVVSDFITKNADSVSGIRFKITGRWP